MSNYWGYTEASTLAVLLILGLSLTVLMVARRYIRKL